ncbi:ABC transporter ATP-binding protein [Spiroplasma alleghenense]|uniref:ABC transporter ATP-binding protein n=1 Tax=Spiroplasma alleghenense TaxID=216931 RepID=A0A345Z3N4_9MOLU|nr:ABC transporter ATP-binding protein [Spiroplasma alleghenense]AXK51213.1 ABC transporter ATP-binding protein [Spiroplasma alleghenense]
MLEVKRLWKVYKNGSGIRDVSFKINQGDLVAFVGSNGAGKTTTIKTIFKEIKSDTGSVKFRDKLIDRNSLRKMAFFPDSNNIPLDLKVNEYVEYVGLLYGIKNSEIDASRQKLMSMMGILSLGESYLKDLSAGEKKKAIMVATLIYKPELIIFDEPTANLDVKSKLEFIEIIKKLHKEGITIMITSHLIDELQLLSNWLIIIDNGKILYDKKFDNKTQSILKIHNSLIAEGENNLEELSSFYK